MRLPILSKHRKKKSKCIFGLLNFIIEILVTYKNWKRKLLLSTRTYHIDSQVCLCVCVCGYKVRASPQSLCSQCSLVSIDHEIIQKSTAKLQGIH